MTIIRLNRLFDPSPTPFWLGDTTGGLWVAFMALAMHAVGRPGHYFLGQASCLQKPVEGELCVERPEPLAGNSVPWDADPYRMCNGASVVEYNGDRLEEPIRLREWKLANLWHVKGRMPV